MSESRTESSFMLLPAAFGRGPSPLARLRATVDAWRARVAERNVLLGLDERMLRDIGVTKLDIWQEASKPFWRP
jgi:uncharacterized protein YjiS (DUF1127 family)